VRADDRPDVVRQLHYAAAKPSTAASTRPGSVCRL
jgi:hypothetical protein